MKVDEMKRLLDAYYAGATDEHEEERLKEALRTASVPEHLRSDKRVLLALEEAPSSDIPVPEGLEERLSRLIDRKDEEEPHFIRRNRARRNWRWVAGVAATVLLLFGIGWGVTEWGRDPFPDTPQDTFRTPEEAFRALQATLSEVSRNWRAGMEQMQEAQDEVCIVNEEVKQELSK